jgi:imidazoleglycerol phosphate synthase cyclase subunit
MVLPRVIPALLLNEGRLVKTVRFANPRYVGDPINTVKLFNDKEVDEIVVLDIAATQAGRGPDVGLIEQISSQCFMPLCVGGGVSDVATAETLLGIGVEKVLVNTHALGRPALISDVADRAGTSSVVVGIDVRRTGRSRWEVVAAGGRRGTGRDPVDWAREVERLGAGEILLMAVDRDGTMEGYDLDLVRAVVAAVGVPVVAAGGAGTVAHLVEGVRAGASAVAAGSMFVYHGPHRAVLVNVPRRKDLERAFEGRNGVRTVANSMAAGERRTCARCVMDTSDPAITFDVAGICNHCREMEDVFRRRSSPAERAQQLATIVADIRRSGRGRPYDCIVGVSGGIDSTYVAYQVKRLGLRPLAVHLDNGWNSELAVDNVARVLDGLGMDLQTYVVDWDEFRDLHLAFLRASVINSEIPTDHAIMAALFRAAAEHGVRWIIGGSNTATEGVMPHAWVYNYKDLHHLRAIHRQWGSRPLRSYPTLGVSRYLWYTLVRRIHMLRILDFIEYDKHEVMRVLTDELGWRPYGGKHYESVYTRFYQGHLLPHKFGVDKRRAHLSALIVSGQTTREEALGELAQPPYGEADRGTDRAYVIRKLGLTEAEFDRILAAETRPHESYPNHAPLFRFLLAMARWRRRRAGGARYR